VPCAGYSGFVIEPCSGRLLIREEPGYAMHALTNCQPFGRSDRPVAALSAVARCDAIRIGFLRQSLKLSSAGAVCLTETVQIVKRRKRNKTTSLLTDRRSRGRADEKRRCPRPSPPALMTQAGFAASARSRRL
jgi:hypothetical protein